MKWKLGVAGMLALCLCSVAVAQTAPAGPTLTIKGGSFKDAKGKDAGSSGMVAAGARVWITADDAAPDMAFDKWTGDTAGLAKNGVTEPHVLLIMPAGDVTLTATYKENKSIRVACIGDTPTNMTNYPKDLVKLLNAPHVAGDASAPVYDVRNYAVDDSTIVQTEKPWNKTPKYAKAIAFQPNIVIFLFGTQDDQKGKNLDKIDTFVPEYEKLIGDFASLPTKPKIFICLPAPIGGSGNWGMTDDNMESKIVPAVKTVAKDLSLPVIDLNTPFTGHPELFNQGGVHLTGDSHAIIAANVYKAIAGSQAAPAVAAPATRPAN